MPASTIPRNVQLTRSAQGRATIISTINASDKALSRNEIFLNAQQKLEEIGYADKKLDSFLDNLLYNMHKSNLIHKCDIAGKAFYTSKASQTSPDGAVSVATKKKPVTKTMVNKTVQRAAELINTVNQPAAVTVDIVRASGRVRVSFKGLVIEIGVVD